MCSETAKKKIYTRNEFTTEEEEILIDLVRGHSFLYIPKDKLYKNVTARGNCWREIGEILKKKDEKCLKKWNSIRDYYVRKRGKPPGTGSDAEFARKRMAQLVFLEDMSVAKLKTISNVEIKDQSDLEKEDNTNNIPNEVTTSDGDIENECPIKSDDNHLVNTPSITQKNLPKRRKLKDSVDETLKKNSEERMNLMRAIAAKQVLPQDDLHHFFTSINETVKKFPPLMQAQAKLSVANTIGKMEIKFLQSQPQEKQRVVVINPAASPDLEPVTSLDEPPESDDEVEVPPECGNEVEVLTTDYIFDC